MVIWKYTLKWANTQSLNMPQGAQILTAQVQGDNIYLWAICDPNAKVALRMFKIIGTGDFIDESELHQYIGTVQISGYVWHVFEYLGKP